MDWASDLDFLGAIVMVLWLVRWRIQRWLLVLNVLVVGRKIAQSKKQSRVRIILADTIPTAKGGLNSHWFEFGCAPLPPKALSTPLFWSEPNSPGGL